MTTRTKVTSGIAVSIVLLAAAIYSTGTSVGASSGLTAPSNPNNPVSRAVAAVQSPTPEISAVEASQSAAFAVLDSSGLPFPSTFSGVSGGPMAANYGLNLGLARPVAGNGAHAWLIPGDGGLCLWITNSGGKSGGLGCAATAEAVSGKLSESRMTEAGVQHVVGVVPDGTTSVTVNGHQLPIDENGWETTTGQETTTATITTSTGTRTVEVP